LARKPARYHIDRAAQRFESGERTDIFDDRDARPMRGQHLSAERFDLAEPDGAEASGSFQPEVDPADPRE
jgi:hypothetical protein